jgi:exonuclease SbcC
MRHAAVCRDRMRQVVMMGAPSLRYRLLMFDFLFKRATKPAVTSPPPAAQSTTSASQVARGAARAQAACADFLLVCEFADARLIAAQSIHSEEALQRVLKAVRNSDRRVARLMQSRLDALQTQNKVAELAEQCVGEATSLTTQPYLTAQKVGDIDRRWSVLAAPPSALQEAFNAARGMLS